MITLVNLFIKGNYLSNPIAASMGYKNSRTCLEFATKSSQAQKKKIIRRRCSCSKSKSWSKKMKQEEREEKTEKTLEVHRNQLVQMFNEGSKDLTKVKVLMENNFSKRRKDAVVNHTRVWKLVKDYPYLKHSIEVSFLKFIRLIDVV